MASRLIRLVVLSVFIFSLVSIGYGQSAFVHKDNKKQGWLGVNIQDVTKRLKERNDLTVDKGAYITDVVEDSPAEEAGIKEGDVITKFDGKEIDDGDDLTRAVRRTKLHTDVKIEITRKSEHKTLSATIERSKTPTAYSFNFSRPTMPKIPRTPLHMHMFSTNEMYGLELQSLTKQLGEYFEVPGGKGVLVAEVEKGSEADKAGFKAGDVITKVNKNTIRDMDDLHEELSDNSGDKETPFEVIRKGKAVTLNMRIENDDEDEDDDDDLSYNMTAPNDCPKVKAFRLEIPRLHRGDLDNLKEDIREFRNQLREKIRELSESIRHELRKS